MGARAFACALALGFALFPALARAQTLSGVDFATSPAPNDRPNSNKPEAINYNDCIKNRPLNYTVRLTGVGATIEVRTGTNCVDTTNNKVNSTDCGLVTSLSLSGTITTPIESQAIVVADSKVTGSDVSVTCQGAQTSTEPRTVTLNFMLIDSSSTVLSVVQRQIEVDLLGPPAPKSLKAGVGEERLVLDWERPSTRDVASYRFFCDPPPAGATANATSTPQAAGAAGSLGTVGAAGAGALGGSAGAGAFGGSTADDGSAGSTADGSISGAAGTGPSGSGGSTASTDGGNTTASCSSTLIAGELAPVGLPTCGTASNSVAGGEARPLQNGVAYAVAVAAVDALGNAGPLSNVACGTPKEVNDFFETYRNAGGGAGGGFCAFAARPAPGAAALFVVGLLLRHLRRRNTRSARKNRSGSGASS